MFLLDVGKAHIHIRQKEPLVSGAQNIYQVSFRFSADWDGLDKTATFSAGALKRSVVLGYDNQCQIPWEVLGYPNVQLFAGVIGTQNGKVVMPTINTFLGNIYSGTQDGEIAKPPTPGVYDQILSVANEAKRIAEDALDAAADNPGGGGPMPDLGNGLYYDQNGKLAVQTSEKPEEDNTLPITSAAVHTTVGNIEALLKTI